MACLYKEDSEIYEAYILGRLSDAEKSDFEAHLKSCRICQDRLEKEKWLQANLREIGKREMKSEIRKQVEMLQTEKKFTDWGMILRVAAIILFVVLTPAFIYYYQYLPVTETVGQQEQPVIINSKESLAPVAGASRDEEFASRQLKPEERLLGESKKSEQEGEAVSSLPLSIKKMAPIEESPRELDDLEDLKIPEKSTASNDEHGLETLPRAAADRAEPKLQAEKARSIAISPNEAEFFRYDSDITTTDGVERESMYLRSKTLAESQQYQKTWLFRKANQTIIMHLQLLDEKRGKFGELPQKMPAQVFSEDSLRLTIDFQVTPEFYKLDPDSVTLYQPNPQILQIQLPKRVIYEIDLTQEAQEAVQVRP